MAQNKDSLGDRMKRYEKAFNYVLPQRMPVIIRLDGRAFHTLTRGMEKPFDKRLIDNMVYVAKRLTKDVMNCELAYIQSDEISLLLVPYKKFTTQGWFDGEIQKICSVSAGIASSIMTPLIIEMSDENVLKTKEVVFDSRCFVLPKEEVTNYFIWRQNDWTRNSVQMLARSLYSHKELHKKNTDQLNELIFQKGKNWAKLDDRLKNGTVIIDGEEKGDFIFRNNRELMDKILTVEES